MEILRKKVNGATAVNKIRDVPASGVCADPFKEPANHVPPSSSSSSSSSADEKERAKSNEDEEDDDEDEDDDIDGENSDASGSGKDLSIADDPKSPSTNDSSVNLSGPVTELWASVGSAIVALCRFAHRLFVSYSRVLFKCQNGGVSSRIQVVG